MRIGDHFKAKPRRSNEFIVRHFERIDYSMNSQPTQGFPRIYLGSLAAIEANS